MARKSLLEESPFNTDGHALIGKHPSDVPSEVLTLNFRAQNPLKAIRAKCIDCCCGDASEVRKCVAVTCALWPFRAGTNPFRKKRELSDTEKKSVTARLTKRPVR